MLCNLWPISCRDRVVRLWKSFRTFEPVDRTRLELESAIVETGRSVTKYRHEGKFDDRDVLGKFCNFKWWQNTSYMFYILCRATQTLITERNLHRFGDAKMIISERSEDPFVPSGQPNDRTRGRMAESHDRITIIMPIDDEARA